MDLDKLDWRDDLKWSHPQLETMYGQMGGDIGYASVGLNDKLSDEELAFWQSVRDTCAAISGKPPKKYSAGSLTKWYNSLHTDSAEYKMWGNGIALPCAAFVLAGIAEIRLS